MPNAATAPAIGQPPQPEAFAARRAAPERAGCAVPAGEFIMGNDGPDAVPGHGEGPTRRVRLDAFRIAATAVTNADFSAFVRATRYVTEAEQLGSSFVFYLQMPEAERRDARQVVSGLPSWLPVPHASWQCPEGPGSDSHNRPGHPVVHVSWNDAKAYCRWAVHGCPTKRNGNEPRAAVWEADDLPGAAN